MKAAISIQFHSYWHIGSGHGRGHHVDAVVDRHADRLPYVPGRMIKGLLRDAFRSLESFGHVPAETTRGLFGGETAETDGTLRRTLTRPGLLAVSDGTLPAGERAVLAGETELITGLFDTHYATAIDDDGMALEGSLRGIEVAVPVTLHCTITGTDPCLSSPEFRQQLELALGLVKALGAHRSRGLGRATLSLQEFTP